MKLNPISFSLVVDESPLNIPNAIPSPPPGISGEQKYPVYVLNNSNCTSILPFSSSPYISTISHFSLYFKTSANGNL